MIKPLGVILVLLAILVQAAAAETLIKNDEGIFVSEPVQGKMALEPGRRIVINAASTLSGELTLKAKGDDCRYTYKKILKTPTKVEAGEYAAVITVEAETQKDAVVISLRAPARAPWSGTNNSGRLAIEILIPENCAVEINTSYFDIDAVGPFSGLSIAESLSKVQVEKIIGPVDVKVSNRTLIIKDVTGELTAANKYGLMKLENINTGDGLGMISNEHGEINIVGYRGALDVRTSYDRIVGQNLYLTGARNRFKNTSAVIDLSFDSLTTGTIRINNQYEDINLDIKNRVDAQFICKIGEAAVITAENLDIVPSLVDDTRLEFESGGGTAEVRLTARGSGDIAIKGSGITNMAGGGK